MYFSLDRRTRFCPQSERITPKGNSTAFITSLIFILIAGLTSACSPKKPTPNTESPCYVPNIPDGIIVRKTPHGEDVWIFENEGRVCFYPISDDKFKVSIWPSECFSSGCTWIYERDGSLKIDKKSFTIQIESRFAVDTVKKSGVVCACADDCDGAGRLNFETQRLKDGVYSVKLGDAQIGQLVIPFTPKDLCLSSETTATPFSSPAPAASTPDPASYPPPAGTPLATPTANRYP